MPKVELRQPAVVGATDGDRRCPASRVRPRDGTSRGSCSSGCPTIGFDWKPHAKSMLARPAGQHLATMPMWGIVTLEPASELDLIGYPPQAPPADARRHAGVASTRTPATRARRSLGKTDAELMAPWSLKRDGKMIFSMPKVAVWRSFVMNHLIHHRAQLSVYLRLLDVPAAVDLRSKRGRGLVLTLPCTRSSRSAAVHGRRRSSSSCSPRPTAPAIATASPIRRSTFRSSSTRTRSGRRFRATRSLIDAQGRLMLVDEMLAGRRPAHGALARRALPARLSPLGAADRGRARAHRHARLPARLGRRRPGAAFTLRHRIPRTSANSFEPYFHPRMLAFGIGLLAVAPSCAAGVAGSRARRAQRRCSHDDGALVCRADWRRARDPGATLRRLAVAAAVVG